MSKEQTAEFANLWVGDRQITLTHFYGIGRDAAAREQFAVGWLSHDGIFSQGVVRWDGEQFTTREMH